MIFLQCSIYFPLWKQSYKVTRLVSDVALQHHFFPSPPAREWVFSTRRLPDVKPPCSTWPLASGLAVIFLPRAWRKLLSGTATAGNRQRELVR
jgi:hypothetical protein